jgi:spore coat polysaccharide biosynthesis protein SpsF
MTESGRTTDTGAGDGSRVVAVIQARIGSTRLPGKVMLPLAGEHVLTHDVRRLRATPSVDRVVVATSTEPPDDIVARYAERAGAAVHRGSETDVLGRLHGAARAHDADVVIRATGDDPLVAPAVVDACAERVRAGADYAANTIERTFPQGLVVEALSMPSFDRVERDSTEPHQREHVTQLYLEAPDRFDRANVRWNEVYDWPLPGDRRGLRFALDQPDDYELLRAVYEAIEPDDRGIVPVRDAVEHVVEAGLAELNRHVGQTKVQGDE